MEPINAGEGAPLNLFKSKYPVLFDCLYSVFGTMLSNSRLCEQTHGMMRHAMRSQLGVEQADEQTIYNAGIRHEMNEERRSMGQDTTEHRDKKKKAAKHSRTKDQIVRLSEQVTERARQYDLVLQSISAYLPSAGSISAKLPTIKEINDRGRQWKDKENLEAQMREEDERAGNLCRVPLTLESVEELAKTTKLTNDATYVAEEIVMKWRPKV